MVVHRYPAPANQDDFADFCVRLLRKVFRTESFERYGKSGDKQFGVDVLDIAHSKPFRVAQCKCHELHKYCPPSEIEEEVKNVKSWEFPIDEFYILTTGKKSRLADDAVLKLNRSYPDKVAFKTTVWSWEDIERKLAELDPAARDYVLHAGSNGSVASFDAVLTKLLPTFLDQIAYESADYHLQKKLELVERHIKNNDRLLSKYELDQIEQMSNANQTAKDRYLVHRLNAKYLMLEGDFDGAAKRFLKAYDEQPDLDQAKINRAVAFELLGQKDDAWNQAEQLLSQGIRTEPLPAIAYRTAPKPHSEKTITYYKDQLNTSENLNLVIADEMRAEGRFEDSIAACDRALGINQTSSRARLLRAFAYHSLAVGGDRNMRRERLEIAERDYHAAKDETTDSLQAHLHPDLYRNLANVQFLLDRPEHTDSFEQSIRVAKDKHPYVEHYLGYLCDRLDFQTAERILERYGIDENQKNHRFLKLVIKKNQSQEPGVDSFIQEMLKLYLDGEFERRDECLGFFVQWSIDSGRAKEAIACLDSLKVGINPFEFHCCMAWLNYVEKNETEARTSAYSAKSLLLPESPLNFVCLLGRLLVDLDDDEGALPVLKQAADWLRLTPETRLLLDCAQRLQKHDLMLEVCKTLRKNKSDTKQTRSLELQILYAYVPQQAKELIDELVLQYPNDPQLYAWLCHIETRLNGKFDALDVTRLPHASETAVFDSQRVLGPLLGIGRFGDAIRFAYENLRCNQGDEVAHGRYLWIFRQYAARSDLQFSFTEVVPECTVRFSEKDGPQNSITITSDSGRDGFNGEISSTSELAKALIGAKVGDEITFSAQSMQPRVVIIEDILSKFVYRFQQVLENFQLNFPHANTIQMLRVMDGDELNVSILKRGLEERRKHIDTALDVFKNSPFPISMLATWLGIDYRDTFEFLTTRPEIGIRCSLLDFDVFNQVKVRERTVNGMSIVLDESSLVTIENLDLWKHLRKLSLVVMRSVTDLFESQVETLEIDKSIGTLGLTDNGQLFVHESTEEERENRLLRAKSLTEHIREYCIVEDSLAAASVSNELRKAFSEINAYPSLESIAYTSRDSKRILWTDEIFMHAVARDDFSINPIGVQEVLERLRNSGDISQEEHDSYIAKLLGWSYSVIYWNADVAFAAAKLSNWDATIFPFTGVIRQFQSTHWTLDEKCKLASRLLLKVYYSHAGHVQETSILVNVMNAIGDVRTADVVRQHLAPECTADKDLKRSMGISFQVWEEQLATKRLKLPRND